MKKKNDKKAESLITIFLPQNPGNPDEYHTTEQLMTLTGAGRGKIEKKLRELFNAGRLEVTSITSKRIDGAICRKPAYKLKT